MNESSVFLFSGRDEFETGKGLVYLRPIFRLTKLASLRARATLKKNIITAPKF